MGWPVATNGVPTYDKWGAQLRQIGCYPEPWDTYAIYDTAVDLMS